jgi:CheY-like chemotaxis protein
LTKVLFVDDDKDIIKILKGGLTKRGFEVDVYENPKEALLNFTPNVYDLVILDVKMPEMNGYELYVELKKKDPDVKINFLTAFEFNPEDSERFVSDLTGVIQKPVTIAKLVEIITEQIKK